MRRIAVGTQILMDDGVHPSLPSPKRTTNQRERHTNNRQLVWCIPSQFGDIKLRSVVVPRNSRYMVSIPCQLRSYAALSQSLDVRGGRLCLRSRNRRDCPLGDSFARGKWRSFPSCIGDGSSGRRLVEEHVDVDVSVKTAVGDFEDVIIVLARRH